MKNFRPSLKIILVAVLFSAAVFLVSHSALAATISTNELFGGTNGANFASTAGLANVSLVLLIANIIRAALGFVGVVAVCFVIYAGFLWTTAGGEEEKIKKAKQVMKNALIGLVIILSSFAIAQFFISRITTAMGAIDIEQSCTGSDCGCTGLHCEDCDGSSCDLTTTFVLQPLDLACAATIQNYQPRFVFSQRVIKTEIVENGMISIKKDGVEVEGTFSAIGGLFSNAQSFIFSPETICISNPEFYCFEAGVTYNVTVSESLQSSNGYDIECSTTFPCSFSFTVGSEIDIESPVINMTDPGDGDPFIVGSLGQLQASAEDDIGVSAVNFWVDEEDVDSDGSGTVSSSDPDVYYFDGWWDTTGNVTNHEYTITAEGSDCAGNSDSGSVDVMLRAANCSNLEADSGNPWFETGTCVGAEPCDCGGDGEYYCGACNGAACYENSDCRSGSCVNGVCANTIEIVRISPGDGAEGNLVTISGSGFGITSGTVTFLGVDGGQGEAVNSNLTCDSWWSDNQVVVQVPEGAQDGPIRITNNSGDSGGLFDQTDDDNGSVISDFDVNTTVRPGICSILPPTGYGGDSVTVSGKNFGSARGTVDPSDLYFGIYEATNYSSVWSATAIGATTPLLNSGTYNVQFFSGAVGSREGSNTVTFRVDTNQNILPPVITDVDSGLMGCSNSVTTSVCEIDSECAASTCVLTSRTVGQCANDSSIVCAEDSECGDSI